MQTRRAISARFGNYFPVSRDVGYCPELPALNLSPTSLYADSCWEYLLFAFYRFVARPLSKFVLCRNFFASL